MSCARSSLSRRVPRGADRRGSQLRLWLAFPSQSFDTFVSVYELWFYLASAMWVDAVVAFEFRSVCSAHLLARARVQVRDAFAGTHSKAEGLPVVRKQYWSIRLWRTWMHDTRAPGRVSCTRHGRRGISAVLLQGVQLAWCMCAWAHRHTSAEKLGAQRMCLGTTAVYTMEGTVSQQPSSAARRCVVPLVQYSKCGACMLGRTGTHAE